MEKLVENALYIAVIAHKEQFDKAGEPYIFHPVRVASKMSNGKEKAIALLHDVLEDCDPRVDIFCLLMGLNIPDEIVSILQLLSRKENESYMEYINRLSQNSIARKVKMADLKDNMNLDRLPFVSHEDQKRYKKYLKAYNKLSSLS